MMQEQSRTNNSLLASPCLSVLSVVNPTVARRMRPVRPRTPDQLHAWVRIVLGFDVPRAAMVPGHDAPFDYVCHAYFETTPANAASRDCIVWAGRGCGKTQLGAVATLLDLLFKPGIQVRILGGSFEQSTKMHRYLKRMLESELFVEMIAGQFTGRHVELTNGSRVEVLSQSERAVRGHRVHKLRCDEVELFEPEVWQAAQLVTRSGWCGETYVHGSIEALSTMHRPFGLMQRLVHEAGAGGRRVLKWGVLDVIERCPPPPERECAECPLWNDCGGRAKSAAGFISIDDVIRQQARVSAPTWHAEMLCRRPSRSDSVYPEFDPAVHVSEFEVAAQPSRLCNDTAQAGRLCHQCQWIGGMDFGYRGDTALLWAFVDSQDVLHIVDELIVSEQTVEQVIAAAGARPWPRPAWIGADAAGHQRSDQTGLSAISLWRKAGWRVRTRVAPVAAGIDAVRRRLQAADGKVRLRIHPTCVRFIEALTMYHYPQDPRSLAPVKDGHDHACDALRYMIVNLDAALHGVRVREY